MNENQKTISYVAVAALALVFAWEPWRPATTSATPEDEGKELFETFADDAVGADLRIVQFDEATSTPREFHVTQVDGVWSIPSHSGYPADAKDHMAAAAHSLKDLKILDVVSDKPGDHELYGVIDPDPKSLKPGDVGVGMRTTIKDAKENVLADVIIGKAKKEDPSIRYVRRANQQRVYTVKFTPDKLSTKFEDWIEKDLLKLNAWDVKQVQLNDYSFDTAATLQGIAVRHDERSRIKLAFEDEKSTWKLLELTEFQDGQPVTAELAEDEELNTEKLNALKTALDDLKIVDVERKPKGLSGELRVNEEEFVKDQETVVSLARRGFTPFRGENDQIEIMSSEGEVLCGTKEGVEYVLRFGKEVVGEGEAGGDKASVDKASAEQQNQDPANAAKPPAKDSKGLQLNRYLFVTARFNADAIAKPALEAIPGTESSDAEPSDAEPADADSKDEAKDEAKEEAAEKPADPAAQCGPPNAAESKAAETKATETKAPETKATETKADPDKAEPADKPDTAKPDAAKPDAAKPDAAAKPDEPAKEDAEKKAAQKREAVEKENKRKQDEYDAKIKQGQQRVKELNERFADWYYVISDDVYKKIHLGRADLVKKKEKPKGEGDSLEDFNELEKGLKPPM